jgi:hypothetical protein
VTAGIGGWSEAVFSRSLRDAVDENGQKLCVIMAPYPATSMSDIDLKNVYAYLLTVPNDAPNVGTSCP